MITIQEARQLIADSEREKSEKEFAESRKEERQRNERRKYLEAEKLPQILVEIEDLIKKTIKSTPSITYIHYRFYGYDGSILVYPIQHKLLQAGYGCGLSTIYPNTLEGEEINTNHIDYSLRISWE